jgi:methyl-accepting chemotaxis protein
MLIKHITTQSIRFKLVGIGLGSILLTSLTMMLVGAWQTTRFAEITRGQVDALVEQDLTYVAQGVYNLIEAQDESVKQTVGYNLNVARHVIEESGDIELNDDYTEWKIVNQFTLAEEQLSLPKLTMGSVWLGQNRVQSISTPIVDEITRLVGGTATIFQRINEDGDMLRVATTVLKTDGSRAIGTYIPAVNPDGQPNPVVAALLRGETYRGTAFVVDAWYVTAYDPIFDNNGQVIGALYVGVKQENISALREAILNTEVGKSGYVYILGGQGEDQGHYIISLKGERDGENIWESQDADGRFFIQEIINKALPLGEHEYTTLTYPWRNPGEAEAREKIAVIGYYAPWDWVIGVGAYTDDYAGIYRPLDTGRNQMLMMFGLSGLLISLLTSILNWVLGSRLASPLTKMVNAANLLAVGDTSQDISHPGQDEIGVLASAFQKMTIYQREMTSAAQRIAAGDLRVQIVPKDEKDELGSAFNQMVIALRHVIGGVQRNAAALADAGAQLTQAAEQTNEATRQISDAIDQVAQGSDSQAQGLEEANRLIRDEVEAIEGIAQGVQQQAQTVAIARQLLDEQLARSIQQVEESVQTSHHVAAQAGQAAVNGAQDVAATLDGMRAISLSTRQAVERMDQMGNRSREIGGIVESISNIAERTNLLALNAAIEAARAGDHGKGFAVVADEVRKLASQAAHATQEIGQLVNAVQAAAKQAISAMDQSNEEVQKGMHLAERTQQGLDHIQQSVNQVEVQIERLSNVVEEMHNSSGGLQSAMAQVSVIVEQNRSAGEDLAQQSSNLLNSAAEIAAISEENSAAAYQVSASVASVSKQMEETNHSIHRLNEIGQQLLILVQEFSLEESSRATFSGIDSPAGPARHLAARQKVKRPASLVTMN